MYNQPELRREVTDRIIAGIKNNFIPWRQPWSNSTNHYGRLTNCVTLKPYRGINALLLGLKSLELNCKSKWWGTEKQWNRLKGQVNPETVGTEILSCSAPMRRIVKGKKLLYFLYRKLIVYNLDQIDGKSVDYLREEKTTDHHPDYAAADKFIKLVGADVRYEGDEAKYILPEPYADWPKHNAGDYILMPRPIQFKDVNAYYETMFHEFAHWSERRVGWKREPNKEHYTYEMGELVAEMTSCFISSDLGLPHAQKLLNFNMYIDHWLQAMQNDYNFIFKASAQASKVTDFILNFQPVERFK